MCSFDGCQRPQHAHGLCQTHSDQRRRGKELTNIRRHIRGDVKKRIRAYVVEDGNGCWRWMGGKDRDGYAQVWTPDGLLRAGRVAYKQWRGPVRRELVLDHTCRVRDCVNPWHLEPVTQAVNVARGLKSYAIRDTCAHGHDITDPANVYVTPSGTNDCRACIRDRVRRYKNRKRKQKA